MLSYTGKIVRRAAAAVLCVMLLARSAPAYGSDAPLFYEETDSAAGDCFGSRLPVEEENSPGLAEIALGELGAEDSSESPLGSGSVKYNEWFYGRRIVNPYADGGYEEQYDWNTVFVCWCADQAGYIEKGRMTRTADGGELYQWLTGEGYRLIQPNDILYGEGFQALREGDLAFIPDGGCGYRVGIVSEVLQDAVCCVAGDEDGRIGTYCLDAEDCVSGVSFIRIPPAGNNVLYRLVRFLRSELGLNAAAASGVIANMQFESTCEAEAVGDMGRSCGLCQWHDERREELIGYCEAAGYDWASEEGQLLFLKYELENAYDYVLTRLLGCEDSAEGAREAGYLFCSLYENPADTERKAAERGYYARTAVYDTVRNIY